MFHMEIGEHGSEDLHEPACLGLPLQILVTVERSVISELTQELTPQPSHCQWSEHWKL